MSAEVLAQTSKKGCHCEDEKRMLALGHPGHLYAGMPVSELRSLGSGCTEGRWVCPRLDALRRRYAG